jgi:hypothetical protein
MTIDRREFLAIAGTAAIGAAISCDVERGGGRCRDCRAAKGRDRHPRQHAHHGPVARVRGRAVRDDRARNALHGAS